MSERFLRKVDIAAMLGTSPRMAAAILRENGCAPIDFGRGKGLGLRWLESAVVGAMRRMHQAAQPATPTPKAGKRPASSIPKIGLNLASMSAGELHAILTRDNPVQ